MRKYEILVSLIEDDEQDGFTVTTKRTAIHNEEANIGWCFGCTIAEALWSLQPNIIHKEFDDIFNAIAAIKEDFDATKEAICPHPKPK